jgi:hypothetical protein
MCTHTHCTQELSTASTRLLYDLLRDPVLVQTDIKHKDVALGFARLTQWTAMTETETEVEERYEPMLPWYSSYLDGNLRYTRARAIERYINY